MPRPSEPGWVKLAGSSIAWVGTVVPSGNRLVLSAAVATVLPPTPMRLAVHAAETIPSGTKASMRCARPKRVVVMRCSPHLVSLHPAPSSTGTSNNEKCHTELRLV